MKNDIKGKGIISVLSLLLFCGLSTACSPTQSTSRSEMQPVLISNNYDRHVPGTVEYIWEEPMINVVEVPAGLDPEGHYYRPAHQSIVEIRQGRWQYYRDR